MQPFRFGIQVSQLMFDRLLLGGSMWRALGIAGQHADIVSVFPALASGKIGWPAGPRARPSNARRSRPNGRGRARSAPAALPRRSNSAPRSASPRWRPIPLCCSGP